MNTKTTKAQEKQTTQEQKPQIRMTPEDFLNQNKDSNRTKDLEEADLEAMDDKQLKCYINTYKPQIATTSALWQRLFEFNDTNLILNAMPMSPCYPSENNIFFSLLIVTDNPQLQQEFSLRYPITEELEERFIAIASLEFLDRYYKINAPSFYALSKILEMLFLPDCAERLLICFQNIVLSEHSELNLMSADKKLVAAWLQKRKINYDASKAKLLDRGDKELIDIYLTARKNY
ncbi:MAG: hypothetical protein J6C85_05125 [Alphaproteobacteria bacterium]|nr:hypothetical protein [Alphaproteobacteria bacterium]